MGKIYGDTVTLIFVTVQILVVGPFARVSKVLAAPRSTERGFVSAVDQLESTIGRFLAATRTLLCFAVCKFRFRNNIEWV